VQHHYDNCLHRMLPYPKTIPNHTLHSSTPSFSFHVPRPQFLHSLRKQHSQGQQHERTCSATFCSHTLTIFFVNFFIHLCFFFLCPGSKLCTACVSSTAKGSSTKEHVQPHFALTHSLFCNFLIHLCVFSPVPRPQVMHSLRKQHSQ